MTTGTRAPDAPPADPHPAQQLPKIVLRLVRGGPERRAIAAGQADAILDPESGSAFLLPAAQRWLLRHGLQPAADVAAMTRLARIAIDGMAAGIGVIDATGTVLAANAAWRNADRTALGAGVREGANFLAACATAADADRVDGRALAAGVHQVITGERKMFRFEHACDLPRGRCWFAFSVTPAAEGSGARAVVVRDDITDRTRELRMLELEFSVALTLAGAGTVDEALRQVMQAVCESQGWDCGRYFAFDRAAGVLRFQECWGRATPAIERFLARSRDVAFRPGTGLKGRVFRSGQPLWVCADAGDTGMAPAALAPETGNDGTFIFPVGNEGRALGVLAFAGRGIHEPDHRMLQAARVIGTQLGRFLLQQQALAALQRSEARFRRLTELSADWHWEQDRDFRFTECSGAGLAGAAEVVGQRLWDLPGIVAGSADWAAHQAQLDQRWTFCDFEFTALGPDGELHCYSIGGEPVFDADGAFTGYRGTAVDITRHKRVPTASRGAGAPD